MRVEIEKGRGEGTRGGVGHEIQGQNGQVVIIVLDRPRAE